QAGTVLVVDRGTANEETIVVGEPALALPQLYAGVVPVTQGMAPNPAGPATVPAASPTTNAQSVWILANFLKPHNQRFSITTPGYSGPWPPIEVRDYQHAPVVPVAITVK